MDNITIIILGISILIVTIFILFGLVMIGRYEVGIKTRRMFGKPMPQGKIIATNDEVGIQADTLMPGLYWFNPIIWKIEKDHVLQISETQIGMIESIDGNSITTGRLLADSVECNNYQDAKLFYNNGGQKGPQISILRPGTYRINTKAFTIKTTEVTKITEEKIGVVVALDGKPLPPNYIIAPKPINETHQYFQDGQSFIDSEGYRGQQLITLQPGSYYINPLLFTVTEYDIQEVPPGYVAVLRSNIGVDLAKSTETPTMIDSKITLSQPIHEAEEVVLTFDRNERGIFNTPVAPGKYNMNPLAFTAYLVPTSAVTIDWAAGTDIRTDEKGLIEKAKEKVTGRNVVRYNKEPLKEEIETDKATEFFKFSQLRVTSKDGFEMNIDVRLIMRIRPHHASFVIARFGSVSNLIEQIVHPLIDSLFRNHAGEQKAIDFIQNRSKLQREALDKAKEEFEKYHVEAQNLLIAYIDVDESLLATQTLKEIAVQQQEQYNEQAKAQEANIAVQEKSARAAKQKDVIDAKLSIDIEEDKAEALRRTAFGIRDSTKSKADGTSYENQVIGEGLAKGYKAQTDVIGADKLAVIQVMEKVANKQVKIVPDIQVSGDGQSGNLFTTWIATMLKKEISK